MNTLDIVLEVAARRRAFVIFIVLLELALSVDRKAFDPLEFVAGLAISVVVGFLLGDPAKAHLESAIEREATERARLNVEVGAADRIQECPTVAERTQALRVAQKMFIDAFPVASGYTTWSTWISADHVELRSKKGAIRLLGRASWSTERADHNVILSCPPTYVLSVNLERVNRTMEHLLWPALILLVLLNLAIDYAVDFVVSVFLVVGTVVLFNFLAAVLRAQAERHFSAPTLRHIVRAMIAARVRGVADDSALLNPS
jgi:hypothetical protein